jgi:hypothetical protein
MAEFKIPPISTLMGTTLLNYFKALATGHIEPRHYLKVVLTFLIILIATPFRWWEYLTYNHRVREYKLQEAPLFILGHWRSGTTLMHNVLCQDPAAGYLTTYHSLFPHHLSSRWLFENLMKVTMPDRRPADNVKLSVKYPQEDEFTIGNIHHLCYYYWWYFPEKYRELYDKYVRFKGISSEDHLRWVNSFKDLVKKSLMDTGGTRAVFKNPVMTGRVSFLVEAFPDARFIYMYRNPIEVFLSSRRFFMRVVETLWFHEVDEEFIDEMILDVYEMLLKDFQEQKNLIPEKNYIEIRFEDFQKDPFGHIKEVYHFFGLENFEKATPYFKSYLGEQKAHKTTKHKIHRSQLEKITTRWGFAMKQWKYDIPENLEIID